MSLRTIVLAAAGAAGLLPLVTPAATLEVGPGQTYTTIQAAIDEANISAGDDDVRIVAGVFTESLSIIPSGSGDSLDISGGWNTDFSAQDGETIIDGEETMRIAEIVLQGDASVVIRDLSLHNGFGDSGAALLVDLSNRSDLALRDLDVHNNLGEDERDDGGALAVYMIDESNLELVDVVMRNNSMVCTGTVDCDAGAAHIQAESSGSLTFRRIDVIDNSVSIAEGSVTSGGLQILDFGGATVLIEDSTFVNNRASGTASGGGGVGLNIIGAGPKTLRRLFAANNAFTLDGFTSPLQIGVSQGGDNVAQISDSVIAPSTISGFRASVSGDGTPAVQVTNLTVVGQTGNGVLMLSFADNGSLSLANTIVTENGNDTILREGVVETNNLIGVDARFLDPAAGDYSLRRDSPAVDAGTNTPPGGLGPTDFTGGSRINSGTVDIGAIELSDTLFANGFE